MNQVIVLIFIVTLFICCHSAWPLPIPNPSYGWYKAEFEYYNSNAKLLYDISGHGKHAITGGEILLVAATDVKYLTGGTMSIVVWPTGSIPSLFTICSVTRYIKGGKMQKILAALTINWYHGFWNSKRGVAWYDGWSTTVVSVGVLTDWLVMCGKNGGSNPKNILVDGIAIGVKSGGIGSSSLCINSHLFSPSENSDWAFRELMVWDIVLTDADMVTASTHLLNTLHQVFVLYCEIFLLYFTYLNCTICFVIAFIATIVSAYNEPNKPTNISAIDTT